MALVSLLCVFNLAADELTEQPAADSDGKLHSIRLPETILKARCSSCRSRGRSNGNTPRPPAMTLWVLPNGNLLLTTGHGVKEVTRSKEVVFDYQSTNEIYACQRLTNGNTFIGECSSGRLLGNHAGRKDCSRGGFVAGRQKRRTHLHAQCAAARQWPLPGDASGLRRWSGEYDHEGKVLAVEIPAAGGAHSAARLANGP